MEPGSARSPAGPDSRRSGMTVHLDNLELRVRNMYTGRYGAQHVHG